MAAMRFSALTCAGLLFAVPGFSQSAGNTSAPGSAPSQAAAPAPTGSAPPKATPPVTVTVQPDKGRARSAYQAGRRAEQAGDWKAEYAAFTEAAKYDPSNREYAILKEHARFLVVQSLVESAERQAVAGNIPGARDLLGQALDVDPGYVVARERLAELTPTPEEIEQQRGPRLGGLARLMTSPGTKAFDVRGTIRSAYEEIGRQFGVKVIFDGDLADRAVRFQVPDLDFDTAVKILSLQTKTFMRVVDAHTMFVTQDTAQKEKDYSPEVEKELLLPASVTTDEMNETVRMIREMTGITRTQLNTASHTLTVRSTEPNVALAQTLLDQIEQPHGELTLEIDILELDRTVASQLGITPPSSSNLFMLTLPEVQQLESAQNSGTFLQTLQTIFGSSAVSSATGSALPALIAFGGGKTIFLSTMPGATANFGAALSTVHSADRVLLRAQDGKPVSFFVGDRYPIDLGLLSADLSPSSTGLGAALASALASGLSLPRTDYDVGKGPNSVAVSTFNMGGSPDLAVANQGDGTISILKGNGDGTFTLPTTCGPIPEPFPGCITLPSVTVGGTTTAPSPSALAVGDYNDDGNPDIAVTDMANNVVWILLGNGDGTFQTPMSFPTGSNPVALVAQDFDADGQPDLAIVNQGDGKTPGSVTILLGNKVNGTQNGTFAPPGIGNPPVPATPIPVGTSPSAIVAGTFISGGVPSLAVTNKADNTVSILIGQVPATIPGSTGVPNGTFLPSNPPTFATGNGPAGIATADFNGDGNPDLAITNETDATVTILLGNGGVNANLAFTPATNSPVTVGSGPVGIVAATFTGTTADLAIADESSDNADILIGNGDGTFNTPISLPTGNAPVALAAADLNGSGSIDLVSANNAANTVTVTLNTSQSIGGGLGSSSAQTGYPSAEYEDLGLKIKATPRLHQNDEVTLQLQFDIKALSGSSINGIPILSNRNIEQTVRLRENETSVISGILQSNQLGSNSGLPWTSTLPAVGLLTGENTTNIQKTELLILVTPRSLRSPAHDVPAIYAGRGEPSTPPSGPIPPPAGAPPQGVPIGAPNPNQPPQGQGPQGGRGPFFPGGQPGQGAGTVVQPPQPQQQAPPQDPNQQQQQPPQQQQQQPPPQQQ